MATITTRAGKGSPLTHAEVDANFVNLNADKAETTHTHAAATTSVNGFMSSTDKTKLDGVADGATANATDAALRDRATHTGTQAASTISDFNASARGQVEAALVAGVNVTITPSGSGATRQLTIAATGGGGGGATDLSYDAPTRTIASSTGTDAVLPIVTAANAGLADAPTHGPTRLYHFMDFLVAAESPFAAQQAGTGAGLTQMTTTAPDDAPGWFNLNLGTVATNRAACAFVSGIALGAGPAVYEARIRQEVLSDATNTFTERVGILNSVSAAGLHGVFFAYTHSVNGGRFQAICRRSNAETPADTGVTVAAATIYKLRIEVDATASQAVFYINGSVVATITSNIPSGAAQVIGAGIAAVRTAGTAALTPLTMDYQMLDIRTTVTR